MEAALTIVIASEAKQSQKEQQILLRLLRHPSGSSQ